MRTLLARAALALFAAGLFCPVAMALTPGLNYTANVRQTFPRNANAKNCLKALDVTLGPGAVGTVYVLLNGATSYVVDLSSGGGMIRDWDQLNSYTMPCTPSINQHLEVYVASTTVYKINTLTQLK